jgi:hypothetical protein
MPKLVKLLARSLKFKPTGTAVAKNDAEQHNATRTASQVWAQLPFTYWHTTRIKAHGGLVDQGTPALRPYFAFAASRH